MSIETYIAETIAWCKPRVSRTDIRNSLRSRELQPDILSSNRKFLVEQLVGHRSVLLREQLLLPVTSPEQLVGGKLLAYFPDQQLCEGTSELATNGYFDLYDTPPWDTWIGLYIESRVTYLIAWVPPELIDLVEDGIYVNSVNCIDWLSNVNVEMSRKLRDRGLFD